MLLGNNPYPQDERVRREALTLVEYGYTVSVICPRAQGQPAGETVRGVHVYRYDRRIRPEGTFGYVLEYVHAPLVALQLSVRVFRRHGFDVVHAHNPPDTLVFVGAIYKFLTKPWNDEELRLQIRDAFRIARRPHESRKSGASA